MQVDDRLLLREVSLSVTHKARLVLIIYCSIFEISFCASSAESNGYLGEAVERITNGYCMERSVVRCDVRCGQNVVNGFLDHPSCPTAAQQWDSQEHASGVAARSISHATLEVVCIETSPFDIAG